MVESCHCQVGIFRLYHCEPVKVALAGICQSATNREVAENPNPPPGKGT